jgi:hypothetical protein
LSCEKKDSTIIDPVLNFPTISSASITPNTFDTNLVHGVARVVVSSVDPIQKVTVQVTDPANTDRGTFQLLDNGLPPDSTANNGVYTGTVNISMDCRLIGQYKALFLAQTTAGLSSNSITLIFNVINSHDHKPVLTNLVAPDSILVPPLGDTVFFCLKITPTDPDGLCDIKDVFFNTFRPPNDTPSIGNPFKMYDDGSQYDCDPTPNNGIYSSLIILIHTPDFHFGTYKFKFNARDRSDVLSDTLLHLIYVHQ